LLSSSSQAHTLDEFPVTIKIERKIVGIDEIIKRAEITPELIFISLFIKPHIKVFCFYPSDINSGIFLIFDRKVWHPYSRNTLRLIQRQDTRIHSL
jgi:hypothetical protein